MTAYDAAMAVVVVLGMVWGAWRGITWQVASLASLVVGYLVAAPLSAEIAPHLPGEPIVARALAMLAVYAAVSGGIFLAAWAVRTTLRRLKFEAYDRHLGMVLGGLEGALVGVVVTFFVVSLAPESRGPIFASPTGRLVGRAMDAVGPALPGEVRDVLGPFWSAAEVAETEARPAERTPAAGRDRDDPAGLREELAGLGRSAGRALERSIESGEASGLRDLIGEGRDRLGRAAGRAVDDQLQRITRDGQAQDARRRR